MLKVTVDADKLTHWATELSERGMRNAIRRAVDKSATAARKVAVEIIAADIGVPKARIKDAVSKVRRTTQTNLSASFTASKMRVSMLATTGANVNNPARFASLAAAARAPTSKKRSSSTPMAADLSPFVAASRDCRSKAYSPKRQARH
jgi:hypothetical protein